MIGNALALILSPVHVTLWAGMTVYALRYGHDTMDGLEQAEASAVAMAGPGLPVPARTAVAA